MGDEFPEALQIEVTNRCNFNCQMCIRQVWDAKPHDINFDLYKKIAKNSFSSLKKLILYGLGEPFINPNFLKMLKIARKCLPKDGEIITTTNGSLLDAKVAEKVVQLGINSISFSIDTIDLVKLSRIREGSKPSFVLKNLYYMAELKEKAGGSFRLGVEATIMQDNFRDLPNLVEHLAEKGIDYIFVSHVVPYTEEIYRKIIYMTLSKPSYEVIRSSLKYKWNLISQATQELYCQTYGVRTELKAAKIIENFWRKASELGYWINLPLLFKSEDKTETINQLEKTFIESRKIASEYQIELSLPELYPDANKRKCPYIEKNTMVVRSDGAATPCMEFTYTHPMYVNGHLKAVNNVLFGDLRRMSVAEVWNDGRYADFRQIRRNMADNVPWCGDCPYSSLGCYFTKDNVQDCYGNTPGCNECLYSVNLARCNI